MNPVYIKLAEGKYDYTEVKDLQTIFKLKNSEKESVIYTDYSKTGKLLGFEILNCLEVRVDGKKV